eukprot:gene19508-23370_t
MGFIAQRTITRKMMAERHLDDILKVVQDYPSSEEFIEYLGSTLYDGATIEEANIEIADDIDLGSYSAQSREEEEKKISTLQFLSNAEIHAKIENLAMSLWLFTVDHLDPKQSIDRHITDNSKTLGLQYYPHLTLDDIVPAPMSANHQSFLSDITALDFTGCLHYSLTKVMAALSHHCIKLRTLNISRTMIKLHDAYIIKSIDIHSLVPFSLSIIDTRCLCYIHPSPSLTKLSLLMPQGLHDIQELSNDPTKRFIWAEIIYFERWWNDQDSLTQSTVRRLVASKQLEFVGGGWAQNDEAVTHYQAVINQMTLGHQFLLSTFGVTPTVSWQIDPFGPSTLTATLFKQMGIKYHIINRIDERIKYFFNSTPDIIGSGAMTANRSFEFMWYPSPMNYGPEFGIFTHILDHHYNSPQYCYPNATNPNESICTGFDFESDPAANPAINSTNIQQQSQYLVDVIKQRAALYRHQNLLVPFGNDFRYQQAFLEFGNMDKLIAHINANKTFGVNIQYATLSEYFEAVEAETKESEFPTLNGQDYYTYTMCLGVDYQNYNTCVNYWSGYFSSYPLLKQTIRQSDSILRTAETLYSIATATNRKKKFAFDAGQAFDALAFHRNVSGILTHHDAVTGTAKEYVRDNYFDMLYQAQNQTLDIMPGLVGYVLANESMELDYQFSDLLLAGMTIGQVVVVSFTNSLAWNRVEYVRVPVGVQNYAIYDSLNKPIVSQIVQRLDKHGEWELYFEVSVPALGVASYFVSCVGLDHNEIWQSSVFGEAIPAHISEPQSIAASKLVGGVEISIGNNDFSLVFRPNYDNHGVLELAGFSSGSTTTPFSQTLIEYESLSDDCYKFRPRGYPTPLEATSAQFYLTEGPIVQMVTVVYSNNATQLFSVYNETSASSGSGAQSTQFFDLESTVSVGGDHEIAMRFATPIDNAKTFYTSNGIEMIQRTWQEKFYDSFEWSLIAGNFYPSINTAKIQDSDLELAVLLPQSMGASSQANGTLEFLMIRRSNYTQWSINEKLDDTSVTSIRARVLLGTPASVENLRTPHSLVHENPMIPMFAPVKGDVIAEYLAQHNTVFAPLNGQQMAQNLHLLSLTRQWENSQDAILRLMNIYERNQAQEFSEPTTVEFSALFSSYNVTNVLGTTMTGNSVINATVALPLTATLNPIEILTYTISFDNLDESSMMMSTTFDNNNNNNDINVITIV